MKKFFGIGLLALLATAYLTSSCSRDEFDGTLLEAKAEAFSNAFKEVYGDPDPQHTWGFGDNSSTRAFTRAAEPRANEWAATYKVPTPLSEGQKNRVMKYFQYNRNPGGTTMNYNNYFVQQVYKGGYKPLGNGTNGYSTETYLAANQTTYITGGNNMDKLTAGTQHEHVNNFNYGDCGWNNNVLDNNQPINGGTTHSDQIMLMLNTPTTCMGYWNSNASYGHDDRYRLVSAATIDEWARNNADKLDAVDAAVVDEWNRDFVGFDFSQVPSDKILVKTNEKYDDNWVLVDYDLVYATINDGPKTYDYIWDGTQTIKITDANRAQYLYLKDALGNKIPFLSNQRNDYCGYERKKDNGDFSESAKYSTAEGATNNSSIELTDVPYTRTLDNGGTQTENVTALNLKFINKMIADGYYPIQENFRTWISPRDCADGYYSDWIVSLVHAQTKDGGGDTPSEGTEDINVQRIIDGRIFCEDLGSADRTDIDFNDVVFDAFTYVTDTYEVPYTLNNGNKVYNWNNKLYKSTTYNKTDINLLAAGGTIDIQVAQQDVNTLLGIGKTTMANTYVEGASPDLSHTSTRDGVSPYKFTLNSESYTDLRNIPISVKQGNQVRELSANIGDVPQKFRAPVGTPWLVERRAIDYGYQYFRNWVESEQQTGEPWNFMTYDYLYHVKFISNNDVNQLGGTIADYGIDWERVAMKVNGETPITITLNETLQEGDQIAITGYRDQTDNATGTLYIKFNGSAVAQTQNFNNKAFNPNGIETKENTFVFTVTSATAGNDGFQLTKDTSGAEIYITSITVIGGLGAQRGETTSDDSTPVTPMDPEGQGEEEESDPTVTAPTNPTWSGTQAFTVDGQGRWSGQVQIDGNYNDFNNMGNGTYIRIYGYGTSNDWQVQLARQQVANPWTWTDMTNVYHQWGSTVNTSTTIEFGPLPADSARAVITDGKLVVLGKNFVVKYVKIDNSQVSSGSSVSGPFFSAIPTAAWSVPASTTNAQIGSSYATITGGKMYVTNGQTDARDLIKNQGGEWAFQHTNNNTFFKVELYNALQAGDVISVRMQSRTDTNLGLFFSTATSRPSSATAQIVLPQASAQAWTDGLTYTVAAGDGICGVKTFYIYRAEGKSTYFNSFAITRH